MFISEIVSVSKFTYSMEVNIETGMTTQQQIKYPTAFMVLGGRGAATVLKVGRDKFCSLPSQKNIYDFHFLTSGGTKYCLDC